MTGVNQVSVFFAGMTVGIVITVIMGWIALWMTRGKKGGGNPYAVRSG